jgi:hypothetical protein
MSYIHHDRNNEQMLVPITVIRGGTSRGFYFEGKNVPKPGEGLEQFVLAVRSSPGTMCLDGLGSDTPYNRRPRSYRRRVGPTPTSTTPSSICSPVPRGP